MSRATNFTVKPTKPTLAGLIWHERYNHYSTLLNGWLELSFGWHPDGYHVSVAGRRLKGRPSTPEAAAQLALQAARNLCVRVVESLDKITIDPV